MKVYVIESFDLLKERFVSRISRIVGVDSVYGEACVLTALVSMRKIKPDVVLLDMHQLHESGVDVEKDIKNGKPTPKVILMTDHPKRKNHILFKIKGVDYVFNKSFELEKIYETLQQLNEKI